MKLKIVFILLICSVFSSCFRPRDIDYKSIWNEYGDELKVLVRQIKSDVAYRWGNHDFPNNFKYPFDDGFHLSFGFDDNGRAIESDNKNFMIKFYTDRGIMDHFSAFIYTNDKKKMEQFDEETKRDNNDEDVKLEEHWYYIQD